MGYRKGSIEIHPHHDAYLLRQVRCSSYVSHEQLWRFSELNHEVTPRSSFNWRLRRLVEHGLLERHTNVLDGRSVVYALGKLGLEYLATEGEHCTGMVNSLRRSGRADDGAILHALRVNQVHLALKASRLLTKWKGEGEVRSQNELTTFGYAKDYDAIVGLWIADQECEFALEYERVAKARNRYLRIRQAIESERLVHCFVYLTSDYHLLNYLTQYFAGTTRCVFFGLQEEVCRQLLDAPVLDQTRSKRFSLRSALLAGARLPGCCC